MAELIDKKNLFNSLFVRNGKVCPNSDIDNFPTTIDVKEVKKAILEQPTTTKAELRASVIEEFAERLKNFIAKNVEDAERSNDLFCEIFQSEVDEIASQMKGEKE